MSNDDSFTVSKQHFISFLHCRCYSECCAVDVVNCFDWCCLFWIENCTNFIQNSNYQSAIYRKMANIRIDDVKRETDEDAITKRLNKAFESRLDLDRVG